MSIDLCIAGAGGRMGRALCEAAAGDDRLRVIGGTEPAGSPLIGAPAGEGAIHADVATAARGAHVWIDFTTPRATVAALPILAATGVRAAIIGTTGFDAAGQAAIAAAADRLVIVQSGNFSLGVNLLAALVRQAAARLGPDWDVEIVEAHHRAKVDAPSGTALMLGRAAAEGRGVAHDAHAVRARDGQTGPRRAGDIGYAVVRGGGIVGDHDVLFAGEAETLTLSHRALGRGIFAKGALHAAIWAAGRTRPGLHAMADVLDLESGGA
jgi:4-hydroxy-tetrahydrodipicolinate reductase